MCPSLVVQGGGLTTSIEQGAVSKMTDHLQQPAAQTLTRVDCAKRPSSRRLLVSVGSLLGRGSCPGVPLAIRSQVVPLSRLEHCRTVTFISSRAVLAVVTSQWQKNWGLVQASVVIPCFQHWIILSIVARCLAGGMFGASTLSKRIKRPLIHLV